MKIKTYQMAVNKFWTFKKYEIVKTYSGYSIVLGVDNNGQANYFVATLIKLSKYRIARFFQVLFIKIIY